MLLIILQILYQKKAKHDLKISNILMSKVLFACIQKRYEAGKQKKKLKKSDTIVQKKVNRC